MNPHTLPVRYAIVDVSALEALLATSYGWTNVRCQFIKGTMRDVYEVWADGQHGVFFLYRQGERTLQEIDAEMQVMRHLHEHGLSVPIPIPMQNGELVLSLTQPEGMRHAVMTTFLTGASIGRQIRAEMAAQVGQLLSKTHSALGRLPVTLERPALDFPMVLEEALTAFERAAPHRQPDVDMLRSSAALLCERIAELRPDDGAYGLLHGDIIPSNVLQHEGSLALLDFDLCAYGPQVYDVASFLVEVAYWGMDDAVRMAFLSGYEHERALTARERASLPAFQAARCMIALGIPAQHIDTWGRVYFSDAIIDKQLTLIRQMMSALVNDAP